MIARDSRGLPAITSALCTPSQVDGLLAGKLGVAEAALALQIAVRFPTTAGPTRVAAKEQILAPTDVSLSNWTVRPSRGTHTAGAVSVDGYTLTLAVNLWNIGQDVLHSRRASGAQRAWTSRCRRTCTADQSLRGSRLSVLRCPCAVVSQQRVYLHQGAVGQQGP